MVSESRPRSEEQRHNLLPVGRKENDEGLRNSPAYTTPTESQMAQCSAIAMPACLPLQTPDAALCIYPPLSPRFFSPSIMIRPTDVTTKTAQLHGLDRAICLTSRTDIHCSRPSSGPSPMDINTSRRHPEMKRNFQS